MLYVFMLILFCAGYLFSSCLFPVKHGEMVANSDERFSLKGKNFIEIFKTVMLAFTRQIGKLILPLLPKKNRDKMNEGLRSAGNPWGMNLIDYLGFMFVLCIGFSVLSMLIWDFVSSVFMGTLFAIIFCNFWLMEKIGKRQKAISKDLPFAIDLLAISVGAGLGFTSGLTKVIRKGKKGPLRDELHKTLYEMKMGKPRNAALNYMAKRINVSDVNSFVSTLIMADRFGTSIGNILRVLAKQIRLKRMQRAEARAYKAPVKMVFPLVFFIFPTILIMLLGPVILLNIFPS